MEKIENKIKKKILFVAPFQISIRNFLGSGLASECKNKMNFEVIFVTPYITPYLKDHWGNIFKNHYIHSKIEKGGLQSPYNTNLLLRFICAVRLRIFAMKFPDGSYLMHTLSKMPKGENSSVSAWICWLAARMLHNTLARLHPLSIIARKLNEKYKPIHKQEFELIKLVKPDLVVLSSNCVYWLDIRFQIEAKRNNIHVVSFVQSWDNLFSRGPMMRLPDTLMVWSDLMREQAITFHAFPGNCIEVVGAMQFVTYSHNITPEESCADLQSLGIGPKDEYFLYVPGGATAEYDCEDFVVFYDILSKSKYQHMKIIFRPHPQSERGAYDKLKRFPIIFDRSPIISDSSANATSLDTKEMLHMANLLKGATAVISSWATTVLLEAAIFRVPVLQLRWMHSIPHRNVEQLERVIMFQRYMHLREFDSCKARRFCDSPEDLITDLDYLFSHRGYYIEGQKLAVETFVKLPISESITRAIEGFKRIIEPSCSSNP